MKQLLHQSFKYASDIEHFVKANFIQQGDIQTIFYNPNDNDYYLFYWGKYGRKNRLLF